MKNTRLRKGWDSERYLPPELWPEILCWLPVKSLLRFRCVSKSWLSLIENRDFARLHFKNFKNNCDATHLLVVHGSRRKCVVRCSDTFETNTETLLTLGKMYDKESWHFVCSIDGLVLIRSSYYPGEGNLKVWNPSIRKFHEFPSLPEIITSPIGYYLHADIGLGYDPVANDYKHVKLIFVEKVLLSVAVYSLGTGSWKIIPFQGKECSKWHWGFGCTYKTMVYFQGSLYFIARDLDQRHARDLVSFDMNSEVFSSIRLPSNYRNLLKGWDELVLIDGGCSLAVFDTSSRDKSVWVLENSSGGSESMRWIKRYSFRLKYTQFLYIKKNGDVLTRKGRQEALPDEAGRTWVRWDQVASYNPETKEYKIVNERKGSLYVISEVLDYAENLFLLK